MAFVRSGAFVLALAVLSIAHPARAACTELARDLSKGSNDSTAGGQVIELQYFLRDAGYLAATPNGNYGPATTAAVKAFQASQGISQTGTVGPLTRLAIQVRSCIPSTTPATPSQADTSSQTVTSPRAGERLVLGQTKTISWTTSDTNQSLILEDANGIAQGFIMSNTSALRSYAWKVGSVYSSRTHSDTFVMPGTYRIRIRGMYGSEQVSGLFAIDVPSLTVSSLVPSRVAADGESAIVLYGNGFTASSTVYVDDRTRTLGLKLYASSDQKVLVFALPQSLGAGTYSIMIDNGYGSTVNAGRVTMVSGAAQ